MHSHARLVTALLALSFGACDAGFRNPPPPLEVGAQARIGPRGGVVAITDPSSALFGATLHVPPGALREEIDIAIAEDAVPDAQRTILAGPVVELSPSGLTFAVPATLVLPAFEGPTPDALTVAFYDEATGAWTRVADGAGRHADPVAQVGLEAIGTTDHFSRWAAVFAAPSRVVIDNALGAPVTAALIATRPLAPEDDPSVAWTFSIPRASELAFTLDAGASAELELLPGDYLFRVSGAGAARCVPVRVPAGTSPPPVTLDPSAIECAPPEVTLEAPSEVVFVGDPVTLTGLARSSAPTLEYWINVTGGRLSTSRRGTISSGEPLSIAWAGTRPGTFEVFLTVYDGADVFGEARAIVVVRGNERPHFVSLTTDPRRVTQRLRTQGDALPPGAEPEDVPGLTSLTAVAEDPDGDPLTFFWWHALPGNYFDPATGAMLGRDRATGYATDTATGEPFTGSEVLYLAPRGSFLCGGFPLGLWLGLHATVSDGYSVARSWAMIGMECVNELEFDVHCRTRTYCSGWAGERPDWFDAECPGSTGSGPCPGAPDAGACVDPEGGEDRFGISVYYELDAARVAEEEADCAAIGHVWHFPYDP